MNWYSEDDKLLRRYLLDDVTAEEQRLIEGKLLSVAESNAIEEEDLNFVDRLLLAEDELIDDYACKALSERERELFDTRFFFTPDRKQKLILAQEVSAYAIKETSDGLSFFRKLISGRPRSYQSGQNTQRGRANNAAISSRRLVYVSILISCLGVVSWWYLRHSQSPQFKPVEAQKALNQAYSQQRPFEGRITGFEHAIFIAPSKQLGGSSNAQGASAQEGEVNKAALERARTLLFGQELKDDDATVLRLRGQFFLAQKDFKGAIEQLRQAIRISPQSAQLHGDMGAALLGQIERDRLNGNRSEADVNNCFSHLNEALRLDPSLKEALFNRALLKQHERLRLEAKSDWEQYLKLDSNSKWAEEAKSNLEEIEAALQKISQEKIDLRQEQFRQQLLDAQQQGDSKRALQAINHSYSFTGNSIVGKTLDEFLAARLEGHSEEASKKLATIEYIGEIVAKKQNDLFFADLAKVYEHATTEQLSLLAKARRLVIEANAFYRSSKNDCAVELYQQARELFAQVGDSSEELFAMAWIGHCHHQRGATRQNLQVFNQILPQIEVKKYRWLQANAFCGLANGHNSAGLFSRAISDCVRCEKGFADLGDKINALRGKYILGSFYYELGKHEENLQLTSAGQSQSDEVNADLRYVIPFYNYRAWGLSALGFHETAAICQREVILMAERSGSKRLIAQTHLYQALTLARHKSFAEAIASVQRGIEIGRQLGTDESGQETIHTGLLHLGHIQRAAGNYPEALQAFDRVIEFYQHSQKQAYLYGAAKGRLLTLIGEGNKSATLLELERVLTLYEQFRENILEESNRNSFFDQEQDTYDLAIDFAYSTLQNTEQAYAYVELSRARSLLDEVSSQSMQVDIAQQPELVISANTRPRRAELIQRELPDNVQLIEFAVLEKKSIVWLISRDCFASKEINISADKLKSKVDQYLSLVNMQPGKTDQRWREPSKELFDLLIRPVLNLIGERTRLCVSADKSLIQLPFGLLINRGTERMLIEDHLISYTPSANVFLELTARASLKMAESQERLLAVGNPKYDRAIFTGLDDVPETRSSAEHIAAFYPRTRLLTEEKATKNAVLKGMPHADVLHLAMHYVPDPWTTLDSRFPLAVERARLDNGALQLHEIYSLKLNKLRLVVLAACQTNGESYYEGEGAVGAARVFESMGVPLVVASLWPVDSKATSELMVEFHRIRKRATPRVPTLEALRQAQLEIFKNVEYRHPYYWAAFVAVGGNSKY